MLNVIQKINQFIFFKKFNFLIQSQIYFKKLKNLINCKKNLNKKQNFLEV